MKTILSAALFCSALLFTAASAQEPSTEQLQRQFEETLQYLQSPKKQLDEEAQEIPAHSSSWNGQGSWKILRIMMISDAEDSLKLTEEQKQRFSFLTKESELGVDWFDKMRQNPTPEFTQAQNAIKNATEAVEILGDPLFERATEEQKDAYREASMAVSNLWLAAMQTEVEETLTPEQMLQVRKLEMQLMPMMGIPFPAMYEPLDLTDEQKEEMNKITGELKAEFDRLTMEAAVLAAERNVSTYKMLQGKSFASREEFNKSLNEIHRQFVPSEAMRKKSSDLQEQGAKLVTLLQTRLMTVLTDEQLDKMQKILNETPEFAKKFLAEFKAKQEEEKKSPGYVPGPDSWRPGDPVPEQFKQERQRSRFPRGE